MPISTLYRLNISIYIYIAFKFRRVAMPAAGTEQPHCRATLFSALWGHTRNCKPALQAPAPNNTMNTTPIYCFVTSNLCDNKMISWMPPTSLDHRDPDWSLEDTVIHLDHYWIWGRRRANCCWSYYVFSAPKNDAERSAAATTTTTIKKNINTHHV